MARRIQPKIHTLSHGCVHHCRQVASDRFRADGNAHAQTQFETEHTCKLLNSLRKYSWQVKVVFMQVVQCRTVQSFSPPCLLHGQFFGGTHIDDRDSGLLQNIAIVVFKYVTFKHVYISVISSVGCNSWVKNIRWLSVLRLPHQFGHHVGRKVFFAQHPWPQPLVGARPARQRWSTASASPCLFLPANFGSALGANGRIHVRTDVFFRHPGLYVKFATSSACFAVISHVGLSLALLGSSCARI